jgi:hypothetical protein
MFEKCCNFNPILKNGAPIAPLFDLGVDFDVFYAKIWVFGSEFSF